MDHFHSSILKNWMNEFAKPRFLNMPQEFDKISNLICNLLIHQISSNFVASLENLNCNVFWFLKTINSKMLDANVTNVRPAILILTKVTIKNRCKVDLVLNHFSFFQTRFNDLTASRFTYWIGKKKSKTIYF